MESESWLVEQFSKVIDWIFSIEFMANISARITTEIISLVSYLPSIFLSMPVRFLESEGFQFIYNIIFVISSSIAAAVVLYQAFLIGLGKNRIDDYIEMIVKLMFMPLFSYFADDVVIIFIKLANQMTDAILDAVHAVQPVGNFHLFSSTLLGLAKLVFLVVFAFYMFKIFLHYARRNFRILELVAYAPIIYLISCIPRYNDKLDLWIHEISALLITQIVHSLEFLILSTLTVLAGESLAVFITQVGALMCMDSSIKTVERYITPSRSVGGAGNISRTVNKYKNKAKRQVVRYLKTLF